MGIKDFFIALGSAIGWVLLILSFTVYISFRDYLEDLPNIIVALGMIITICVGIILVLMRNASRIRESKKDGGSDEVLEKIVHITPIDDLKHDILALIAFGLVVVWVLFTGNEINGNDLAQASIAFISVMLVRKIYKERLY